MGKKKISGQIQNYSRKARDAVIDIAEGFLKQHSVSGISMNLFTCVDELVKNAVKANYKFLLIHEKINEKLKETYPGFTDEQISDEIKGIIKIKESFDHIAGDILNEHHLSARVREILNEESKLLNIKN